MAFPAPKAINLNNGQRAERKLLITVVEWEEQLGTGTTTRREILGRRTEDSSIEYNSDIATSTDILGITYTDLNKTEPQQDFDPFLVMGGGRLAALLVDVMNRNGLSELNQFTAYIIDAFLGDATNGYEAVRHTGCSVIPTSIGGDVNVNMPIELHFSNNLKTGTVDKLSDDFTFTEDA